MSLKLLTINADAKTVKGIKKGYLTGILYLAPSDESGAMNVCPHASVGCRLACLYTAGRGRFQATKDARIKKTHWFKNDRAGFLEQLAWDIAALVRKAKRMNLIPAVRLNGTSDLPWENFGIMFAFPDVQFYDYTKNPKRAIAYAQGKMPSNYHLTFSRSEDNGAKAELMAQLGVNVAAVFSSKNLPPTYYGVPVVNGDESDLRFLDKRGCVVGLYAKGKAKKDASGFVIAA